MDPPRIFFRVVFFLDLPPALKKEKEAWDRGSPEREKRGVGPFTFLSYRGPSRRASAP